MLGLERTVEASRTVIAKQEDEEEEYLGGICRAALATHAAET